MKVYIIGAGPGHPDLITVRGAQLIERCPIILYTGSLVPKSLFDRARTDAKVLDSSGQTLEEIIQVILDAKERDEDVARVHTGDPSIFGSTAEQVRRFEELSVEYEIVPGVSSFTASAAVLAKELTLPELSQTVIITRVEGRTPMPEPEQLRDLAKHQSTMVLFLSITLLKKVTEELIPEYGADCPVAVVHKATCPEEQRILGTLSDIHHRVQEAGIRSQSIIIVGHVLTSTTFKNSKLYDPDFSHGFRKSVSKANRHYIKSDIND